MIEAIRWLTAGLGVYLALGVLFALVFVTRGVGAVDPAARGGWGGWGGWGFRVLIMPGTALLWPVLAKKWADTRPTTPVPLSDPPTDDGSAATARLKTTSEATTVVESGPPERGGRA